MKNNQAQFTPSAQTNPDLTRVKTNLLPGFNLTLFTLTNTKNACKHKPVANYSGRSKWGWGGGGGAGGLVPPPFGLFFFFFSKTKSMKKISNKGVQNLSKNAGNQKFSNIFVEAYPLTHLETSHLCCSLCPPPLPFQSPGPAPEPGLVFHTCAVSLTTPNLMGELMSAYVKNQN